MSRHTQVELLKGCRWKTCNIVLDCICTSFILGTSLMSEYINGPRKQCISYVFGKHRKILTKLRRLPRVVTVKIILFSRFSYFLCTSVLPAHVYMCTTSMTGVRGGQKSVSSPLELELQTVVCCLVGAGN